MRGSYTIFGMLCCIFIASMLTTNLAVAGADDNLSDNPGAEEVAGDKPKGWNHYRGAAATIMGHTTDEAHSGERSAYLTVTQYTQRVPDLTDYVSGAIMFGDADGYTGANGFELEGDTEYYYAFWTKAKDAGDFKTACLHVRLLCWVGGVGNANRQLENAEGFPIKPTEEWTLYTGTLTTPADTRTGVLRFHVGGNNKPVELGGTFYVDDAYLGLTPPPDSITGPQAVDSTGKLATTWGGIKDNQ